MNNELILALDALEKEKRIKKEIMFEALEAALVTAYKKNFGSNYNCFGHNTEPVVRVQHEDKQSCIDSPGACMLRACDNAPAARLLHHD